VLIVGQVLRGLDKANKLPQVVKHQLFKGFQELAISDAPSAAEAALQLSVCYCIGFGVTADMSEARNWIAKSATRGSVEARGLVGRFYEACGEKIPSDFPITEWLFQGMISGSRVAADDLQKLDPAEYRKAQNLFQLNICSPDSDWLHSNGQINMELVQSRAIAAAEQGVGIANLRVNDAKDTLLHYAAAQGNVEFAEALLRGSPEGAIDVVNVKQETALLYACRAGHPEMVRYLISNHANVQNKSLDGVTPLHWIISMTKSAIQPIAELLVLSGADTEAKTISLIQRSSHSLDDLPLGTPLSWAIATGNEFAVRTLLNLGAIPAIEVSGLSLLREAVSIHSPGIVQILLREDICNDDIGDFDDMGWSILSYAISGENKFSGMIRHGENYHNAVKSTFQLLVAQGADVTAVDLTYGSTGGTAVMFAVRYGALEILEILLSLGLSEQIAVPCGDTSPLTWAIENEDKEKFRLLMKYRSTIDHFFNESNGMTLLHGCSYSMKHGAFFARELLKHGADINAVTAEGYSPLREAICNGNSDVAKVLLSEGASAEDIDTDGFSILGSVLLDCSGAAVMGLKFVLGNNLADYVVHQSYHLGALHMGICFMDKLHDSTAHREKIDLLLSSFKSHIDEVDIAGRTPLHLAAASGDPYALQALLRAGANLSTVDKHGDTAMDIVKELAQADAQGSWSTRKPALIDSQRRLAAGDISDNAEKEAGQNEFMELLQEEYGLEASRDKRLALVKILQRWCRGQ
jgi:ankyrin repeat protein